MRDAFGVERDDVVSKLNMPGFAAKLSTKAIGAGQQMTSRGSSAFGNKGLIPKTQSFMRRAGGKSLTTMGMNPGKTTIGLGVGGAGAVGAGGFAASRDKKY